MRRAVISIPSNIAEGAARKGDREFIQFIHIALGSLAALETQYLIVIRLNYANKNIDLENLLTTTKKLLLGFRNYLVKK